MNDPLTGQFVCSDLPERRKSVPIQFEGRELGHRKLHRHPRVAIATADPHAQDSGARLDPQLARPVRLDFDEAVLRGRRERCDGRVATQIDFHRRREPAQSDVGVGLGRRTEERRLGEIDLTRDLLHHRVRQARRVEDHAGRVAAERPVGERVVLQNLDASSLGHLPGSASSSFTGRSSYPRMSWCALHNTGRRDPGSTTAGVRLRMHPVRSAKSAYLGRHVLDLRKDRARARLPARGGAARPRRPGGGCPGTWLRAYRVSRDDRPRFRDLGALRA